MKEAVPEVALLSLRVAARVRGEQWWRVWAQLEVRIYESRAASGGLCMGPGAEKEGPGLGVHPGLVEHWVCWSWLWCSFLILHAEAGCISNH